MGRLRVLEATDGPSGLELARRERPDAIALDIRARIGPGARVGGMGEERPMRFSVVGKGAFVPARFVVHAGAAVGPDVISADIGERTEAKDGELIATQRKPHEIRPRESETNDGEGAFAGHFHQPGPLIRAGRKHREIDRFG